MNSLEALSKINGQFPAVQGGSIPISRDAARRDHIGSRCGSNFGIPHDSQRLFLTDGATMNISLRALRGQSQNGFFPGLERYGIKHRVRLMNTASGNDIIRYLSRIIISPYESLDAPLFRLFKLRLFELSWLERTVVENIRNEALTLRLGFNEGSKDGKYFQLKRSGNGKYGWYPTKELMKLIYQYAR